MKVHLFQRILLGVAISGVLTSPMSFDALASVIGDPTSQTQVPTQAPTQAQAHAQAQPQAEEHEDAGVKAFVKQMVSDIIDNVISDVSANDEYDYSASDDEPMDTDDDSDAFDEALGFANLKNTCFANAAMKLLYAHPGVMKLMDPKSHKLLPILTEEKIKKQAEGMDDDELEDLIKRVKQDLAVRQKLQGAFLDLYTAALTNRSQVISNPESNWNSVRSYKSELNTVFDHLDSYLEIRNEATYGDKDAFLYMGPTGKQYRLRQHQMDSQEYLNTLLDLLNYQTFLGDVWQENIVKLKTSGKRWLTGTDDNPSNPRRRDTISMLHVEVEKSNGTPIHFVSDAIANHFRPDRIEGDDAYVNPDTKKKEPGTRTFVMLADPDKVPEQMIVHLMRYKVEDRGRWSFNRYVPKVLKHDVKISGEVEFKFFPKTMTNDELDTAEPVKVKMRPIAVVVHKGDSPDFGHYYAYVYDKELKSWLKHDDSSVQVLKGAALKRAFKDMADNGYLLLYGKR